MKAILTKYHGPGNKRGSRISADDRDGNRIVLSYDDSMSPEENHVVAARTLCSKMKWSGQRVHGWLQGIGEVHVFIE